MLHCHIYAACFRATADAKKNELTYSLSSGTGAIRASVERVYHIRHYIFEAGGGEEAHVHLKLVLNKYYSQAEEWKGNDLTCRIGKACSTPS